MNIMLKLLLFVCFVSATKKDIGDAFVDGLKNGVIKAGLKTLYKPLAVVQDGYEIGKEIYNREYIDATVDTLVGVTDLFTLGGGTIVKETAKSVITKSVAGEFISRASKNELKKILHPFKNEYHDEEKIDEDADFQTFRWYLDNYENNGE